MFEPAGSDETPGPVPMPVPDPDRGLPGTGLDAPAAGFAGLDLDRAGGDGPDGDGVGADGSAGGPIAVGMAGCDGPDLGWDGPPPWLTEMDLAGVDDPPVVDEPWPDPDDLPWQPLDAGPWLDDAPDPEGGLLPWPGGDAVLGWPVFGEVPPSPQLAALLTSVGPDNLDDFDLVEAVAAWERIAAFAHAHQVQALAALVSRPVFARLSSLRDGLDPVRGAALEVSARLRVSIREAEQRLDLALTMATERTATLAALEAGRVDYWRAKTLTDGLAVLEDPATAARVEQDLLQVAGGLSRAGLRTRVAKAVAVADPAAAEGRHARAVEDRQVRCRPEPDAMGSTWALLSGYDTATLDRVLDAAADGIRHAHPDDPRTHAQRRADALAHLAHTAWHTGHLGPAAGDCGSDDGTCPVRRGGPGPDGRGGGNDGATRRGTRRGGRGCRCGCGGAGTIRLRPGRRPQIAVVVPYATLLGVDDQPGELAGYGPLPASAARRIAAGGTWRRLLTDPATGRLLDYGTTRYRPPRHLIDHVIMRDQTCCGIACTRPAAACDIDHSIGYPDGPTADWTLGPPCRPHHNGKTHAGWQLTQPDPGHFQWRSPTGHHYDRPPTQIGPIHDPPPAAPPGTEADPGLLPTHGDDPRP